MPSISIYMDDHQYSKLMLHCPTDVTLTAFAKGLLVLGLNSVVEKQKKKRRAK